MNLKYLNILVPAALIVIGLGLFAVGQILSDLYYSTSAARIDGLAGMITSVITWGGSGQIEKDVAKIISQTNNLTRQIADIARITGGTVALLGLVYAMIFCVCEWRIKRAGTSEKPG